MIEKGWVPVLELCLCHGWGTADGRMHWDLPDILYKRAVLGNVRQVVTIKLAPTILCRDRKA